MKESRKATNHEGKKGCCLSLKSKKARKEMPKAPEGVEPSPAVAGQPAGLQGFRILSKPFRPFSCRGTQCSKKKKKERCWENSRIFSLKIA